MTQLFLYWITIRFNYWWLLRCKFLSFEIDSWYSLTVMRVWFWVRSVLKITSHSTSPPILLFFLFLINLIGRELNFSFDLRDAMHSEIFRHGRDSESCCVCGVTGNTRNHAAGMSSLPRISSLTFGLWRASQSSLYFIIVWVRRPGTMD